MSFCPNCNKQFEDGVKFCDACGTALVEAAAPAPAAEPVAPAEAPAFKLPFQLNKKLLTIGAAALAAILVIAIVVSALFTPVANYVLYAKDDKVMYYDGSGKPWVAVEDIEDKGLYGIPVTTADGKRMYFIQDGDLFYRDVESKKEAVKIHSKVDDFIINENGTALIYLRSGKLYRSNGKKEGEEIAKDVTDVFAVSKDLKKVLYGTLEEEEIVEDGETVDTKDAYEVFLCTGKKSIKVATGVDDVAYTEDLSIVYYTKDGTLYSKKGKKDAVKIAEDVSDINRVYDEGIYYTVVEVDEKKNEDGYVIERNENRSLFFYDGKNSKALSEDAYFAGSAADKAVIAYAVKVETEDKEGYTTYDFEYYIATKAETVELGINVGRIRFSEDGKKAYVLEELDDDAIEELKEDERATTTLHEVKISGKKLDKKSIDTDIDNEAGFGYNAKTDYYWYFKDYDKEDGTFTLFINGKEIKDGVSASRVQFNEKTKTLTFFTDYETDDDGVLQGTLWFSKGGKAAVEVDSEVNSYAVQANGYIAYIKEVNPKNGEGDLCINKLTKKPKKVKPVDTDVTFVAAGVSVTEDYILGWMY